jgi:hypothetical protein
MKLNYLRKNAVARNLLRLLAVVMFMAGTTLLVHALYQTKQTKPMTVIPTSQATQTSAAPTSTVSPTPAAKPSGATSSSAGKVCTTTPTPYGTVYKDDPNTNKGRQWQIGGMEGWVNTCSVNGGASYVAWSIPPIDTIVYVGTYVAPTYTSTTPTAPTTPTSPGISEAAAQTSCIALGTSGTSAYDQCMHAYGY